MKEAVRFVNVHFLFDISPRCCCRLSVHSALGVRGTRPSNRTNDFFGMTENSIIIIIFTQSFHVSTLRMVVGYEWTVLGSKDILNIG